MIGRPPVNWTTLMLALPAAGLLVTGQKRAIVGRHGSATCLGLVALGLAALALPRAN